MEFRILGSLEVDREGQRIALARGKQTMLLGFLLVHRNEVVSADRLVDGLWGERPPPTAHAVLLNQVSKLRSLLGPGRLETRASGYLLRVEPGELDSDRFESLLAKSHYGAALALFRGSPLADFAYESWAQHERGRLEELRLTCLEERFDAELATGGAGELVGELEALVAAHPIRERLRGQLMLALYRSGRQVEALEGYQELRRRLVDELGLEPSRALQDLHRAILNQDPSLLQAPLARFDRGSLPELPAPLNRLIGREPELAALQTLLEADARLVTITGAAGSGKTRLAVELALQLGEVGSHVAFVPLGPLSDPELVLPTIALALGVPEQAGEPVLATLKRELRDEQILLVVDNVEHVLAAAPALSDLLASCHRLRILATSREPLHLSGEHEFLLEPLSEPDAIALFSERARAVKPSFTATGDSAAAVAEICRGLDGLPLALELAAARVKLLSPQAIVARLGRRLELLTRGARDLPVRQQALRSAIEWSYGLLDEHEQALFARLGIFAGGGPLEVVEAVCGGDGPGNTFDGLASLVDKSLLRETDDVDGEPRFTMLETIREYALERLEERGEFAQLQQRHANCYLELVEAAEPQLVRAGQVRWLERLDAENDNIRAALAWAIQTGELELGLRLAGALVRFWSTRGLMVEGRRWLSDALAAVEDVSSKTLAKAHYAAGYAALGEGEFIEAEERFQESITLAKEASDVAVEAAALAQLGWLHMAAGDHEQAVRLVSMSLKLAEEIGDDLTASGAYNTLGEIAADRGDFEDATRLFEEGLALRRKLGDQRLVVNSLLHLGRTELMSGDRGRAIALLTQVLELARGVKDTWIVSVATADLGRAKLYEDEYAEARDLFQEGLTIAVGRGDKRVTAECLQGLALVSSATGDPQRAGLMLGAADAVLESIGATETHAERALRDRYLTGLRAEFGDDVFEAARTTGRVLGLQKAIDLAREGIVAPSSTAKAGR